MPEENQKQELTEAQKRMAEELTEKDDPFAGMSFEATGTNEPPKDKLERELPAGDPEPAAEQTPPGPELTEAEKRFNERLEKLNDEQGAQGEKQKLAQEHGLGPQPPKPPAQAADVQSIQNFIDDVFKVVAHHRPSNLVAIAVLELVKDEYVRIAKAGPQKPQGNIAVPGGAPQPGGIVTPGGPMPPRGGSA